MITQELHDRVATDLAARGLPVDYAQRTAAELADHHRDLVEELQTAGIEESTALAEASGRLGDRQTLVKKSVRAYQRRHWCGRWPLLTFLFGPVVLLIATWVATGLFLAAIGGVLKAIGVADYHQDGTLTTTKYFIPLCNV